MPKLKKLSGQDVVTILQSFGFRVAGQKGSHIKMQRKIIGMPNQTMTIPAHRVIDKGTVKGLYNQAKKYISETDLHQHFYTK